jgi:disease resistance protein RPS2
MNIYLVRYGMGFELFDDINTAEEARYRVYALVDKLIRCSLLLESNKNMHIKMHDVVSDTAISICINR